MTDGWNRIVLQQRYAILSGCIARSIDILAGVEDFSLCGKV